MADMPGWRPIAGIWARARSTYRALVHRDDVEREMHEEFGHHLAERVDHLVREGVAPDAATERARREFGHVATYQEAAREARGLESFAQLRISWIDVRLGIRMLRKFPVLNLAAIFALAIGIPVGLAPSHLARVLEAPLPGDPDNRVRAIRYWDPLSSSVAPTWSGEFAHWAQSLRSFGSLGAFRASSYNVALEQGEAAPTTGAQLSPAVFQILAARPLIGRVLEPGDFEAGAPDVVVIGHGLWSTRFGQDSAVLGRPLRIGRALHVVVGVMPAGFAFPSNESLWLPLRLASVGGVQERARVQILGRLADGVSSERAQAELSARRPPLSVVTDPHDADEGEERARLRAEVVPFGLLYLSLPAGGLASLPEFRIAQALMFVLLLVACGNVAMLVFARTATRLRELAIRTSLGAGRGRLVSQLFAETLVLAVTGAGVGVLAFDWALGHINLAGLAGASVLPYWLSLGLTVETAMGALAFAVISATVAGVAPAIAITGRAIAQHVRGGGSRMRFGRLTGALVVADIAVSVAAVGMAFAIAGHATDLQSERRATGVPAEEYLAVELRLTESGTVAPDPRASGATANRRQQQLATAQQALVAALEREPGVRRVAVGDVLPRMEHPTRSYELDGEDRAAGAPLRHTRLARVDVDFFGALATPILAGRDFARTDVLGGGRAAIVNSAFVERVLDGRDPLGRRLRFPALADSGPAPWVEIVGVVGPLGVNLLNAERGEAVYLAAEAGTLNPLQLAVHAQVPPASLTGRVRELALAADPDLLVGRTAVLSDIRPGDWYLVMGLAAGLLVLVGVLLALATSGLYAMLSLTVSERTREIGIRSALGASRHALLVTVLRRSLVQVGLGAVIGLPLAARFVFELTGTPGGGWSGTQALTMALGLSLGVVACVALGACLVPTRRILAIQAKDAMRADG